MISDKDSDLADLVFFEHVRARLPGYEFRTIFDVGANIGQACIPFSKAADKARIYAFEPVKLTFEALLLEIREYPSITPVNVALGEVIGSVSMQAKGTSTSNRILEGTPLARKGVPVPISTGSAFMSESGVDAISFLKIDTEGHDLAVLKGFGDKLRQVDFIQVEASMNPTNERHVGLQTFLNYLGDREFYLFHIYEQVFEFHDGGRPWLRRANPVFIRSSVVA